MDKYFRDLGYKVRIAQAGRASLDSAVESLDILVVFLLIMAVLTAIVGSMGLTGTMGMNVLERTREIGIMRAIGADDRAVMRTVIAEGIVIGTISFVLAVILSIPVTLPALEHRQPGSLPVTDFDGIYHYGIRNLARACFNLIYARKYFACA